MNSPTYASLPEDIKKALANHFVIDESVPDGQIEIRRPNKRPFRVSPGRLARHIRKVEARQHDVGYLLGQQKKAL